MPRFPIGSVIPKQFGRNFAGSLCWPRSEAGPVFATALRELDRLLRIYPQFGEPLYDLQLAPAQLWIGVVSSLIARYSLDDDRRLGMVVAPFLLLPRTDG